MDTVITSVLPCKQVAWRCGDGIYLCSRTGGSFSATISGHNVFLGSYPSGNVDWVYDPHSRWVSPMYANSAYVFRISENGMALSEGFGSVILESDRPDPMGLAATAAVLYGDRNIRVGKPLPVPKEYVTQNMKNDRLFCGQDGDDRLNQIKNPGYQESSSHGDSRSDNSGNDSWDLFDCLTGGNGNNQNCGRGWDPYLDDIDRYSLRVDPSELVVLTEEELEESHRKTVEAQKLVALEEEEKRKRGYCQYDEDQYGWGAYVPAIVAFYAPFIIAVVCGIFLWPLVFLISCVSVFICSSALPVIAYLVIWGIIHLLWLWLPMWLIGDVYHNIRAFIIRNCKA